MTTQISVGEKSENVPIPEEGGSVKRLSRDSEGKFSSPFNYALYYSPLPLGETTRVTTPTATESQLPWKRGEDEGADGGAVKQNEFPGWASNKEYIAYNSPSATFLGKILRVFLCVFSSTVINIWRWRPVVEHIAPRFSEIISFTELLITNYP